MSNPAESGHQELQINVPEKPSIKVNAAHTEEVLRAGKILVNDEKVDVLLNDDQRFKAAQKLIPSLTQEKTLISGDERYSDMGEISQTQSYKTEIVMNLNATELSKVMFEPPSLRQRLKFVMDPAGRETFVQLKSAFLNILLQQFRQINISSEIYIGTRLLSKPDTDINRLQGRLDKITSMLNMIENWFALYPAIEQAVTNLIAKKFPDVEYLQAQLAEFKTDKESLQRELPDLLRLQRDLTEVIKGRNAPFTEQ